MEAAQHAKLALALSKAQSKFKAPNKNKHVDYQPERGPRVKYSYADLADVIAAIQGPLTENELAVSHLLAYQGEIFGMRTLLVHSSGEFIETWYPLPDPKKENIRPQSFGSALTYARRYSLCSLVGIAADEDTDAQDAPTITPPKGQHQKQGASAPKKDPHPPVDPQHSPDDDLDAALGRTSKHPPGSAEAAGEYVITFGPHRGKRIGELKELDLRNYCSHLQAEAEKKQVEIDPAGQVGQLLEHAATYLGI